MITDFKLFEKSILTLLNIPDAVMKVLQKSFQLKYEIPEKTKSTKSNIKTLLNRYDLILMVNNVEGDYLLIQYYGYYGGSYMRFIIFKYDSDGKLISANHTNKTDVMSDIIVNRYETYIIKSAHFIPYRNIENIETKREQRLRDEKLNDFTNYFNVNMSKIMVKKYSNKWNELVQAVREYYDKITKSIDVFIDRNGGLPAHSNYDKVNTHKTVDFQSMAYTLHNFIEKINNDGVYKLNRNREYHYHWRKNNKYFDANCDKDLINFLKTRKDFTFGESENVDILVERAIDQYGIMKLSTYFGRFVMTTMDDWLRKTIGEYTGLNDEIEKYNI